MPDREAWLRHVRENPDQTGRVLEAMRSGRWWTKDVLAQAVGGNAHAMAARMSDLRKAGYFIEKKHVGDGLYLYRLRTDVPRLHGNASEGVAAHG